jgi:hypothetical protein
MEELGLAQTSANYSTSGLGLEDVIAMIMEGEDPEELLEEGVPLKLIEVAMQKIMMQMQEPQEGMGLAASVVKPNVREEVV